MIKVGYLVSYDYELIFTSLHSIYKFVDAIVLCYDKDFVTWSGNSTTISETFFDDIRKLDTDNKIKFYADTFYLENHQPMDLETRQRKMLAEFMGKGGWHLQIDADEYAYDFELFISFLKNNDYLTIEPDKNPVNVLMKLIVLFKKDNNGYYVVKPFKETCFVATNYPNYLAGRRSENFNIITEHLLIHESWARNEEEVYTKLNNWGHKNDFDTSVFFKKWKSLNKDNYAEYINFHPIYKENWASLEFVEAKSSEEFLEKCKTLFPQQKPIIFKKEIKWELIQKSFGNSNTKLETNHIYNSISEEDKIIFLSKTINELIDEKAKSDYLFKIKSENDSEIDFLNKKLLRIKKSIIYKTLVKLELFIRNL
jgi:hypothetical protein